MGGGGGKSGGSSVSSSGPSPEQRATSQYFLENVSKPIGNILVPQVQEALLTGGVGAQIPVIARAIEASRQAGARSRASTEGDLAQSRLQGTPFGQNILAGQRQASDLDVGMIPIDIAKSFIDMAQGLTTQGGSISIGGPGVSSGRARQSSSNMNFGLFGGKE